METTAIKSLFRSADPVDQVAVFERRTFVPRTKGYNRRDYCKVALVLSSGMIHYATRSILIDRPSLLFSNPMIPYAWEPISSTQEGYFCLFTPEFLKAKNADWSTQDSPVFRIGADPVFFLDAAQQEYISGIYGNMMRELDSDYLHKYDLVRHHLMLLLHEGMKIKPATAYVTHQNAAERIADLFLTLLNRQFPIDSRQSPLELRTANDYAVQLSLHVNSLNRAVKEITGKTTTEHITGVITDEAIRLLRHTDWSIADIAYSLGFEYLTYFNNFFKKYTGQAPGAFR